MKSYYNINIISVVYLFFITYVSARNSFIQQFTDDFNANLHHDDEGEVGPNHDGPMNLNHLMNTDSKVRLSTAVNGARDRPPSTYSLKMESFNTLLNSAYAERYDSRPFTVAGFNWTLVVYPKGNKNDNGLGYISLYVAIDNSTLLSQHQVVYVDLRFYIYNKNAKNYFTIQDTNVWQYDAFKTMWGFPRALSLDTFKNLNNGYLYDGDHCEFGVDVTISTLYQKSEIFSASYDFPNPRFTWSLRKFSTLLNDHYISDPFYFGGRKWNLEVYPNGAGVGVGKWLSMYLTLTQDDKLRPYEKIYVKAKLRVLQKLQSTYVENTIDRWFYRGGYSWGWREFVALSDIRDSSKGFLVNDMLSVQVEMVTLSSTTYFPNED